MAKRTAGGSLRANIEVSGAQDLAKLLRALPAKVAKKILRKALREGAKLIQQEAVARAPVRTGTLRKNIKVRAATRLKRGNIGVQVLAGKGDYLGDVFYASFIEFGHRRGKRKGGKVTRLEDKREEVPPKPFMRPAFDAAKHRAALRAQRLIVEGIEKEATGKK